MHRILIPLIIILLFIIIIRHREVDDEIKCETAYYISPQLMSVPDHVL